MQNEEPKDKQDNDLYLKGQYYYTGKDVNFDEKIKGEYHSGGGEHLWKLNISMDSGRAKLVKISGGMGRNNYDDEEFICGTDVFVDTRVEKKWSWEKAIIKVSFSLMNFDKH